MRRPVGNRLAGDKKKTRVAIDHAYRSQPAWSELEIEWDRVSRKLTELVRHLDMVNVSLKTKEWWKSEPYVSYLAELQGTADQLGRVLIRFGTQTQPAPAPELSLTPEASPDYQPEPESVYLEPAPPADIDWLSVGLGLLALIAVGGLVPFWMWVYFQYNPPIR